MTPATVTSVKNGCVRDMNRELLQRVGLIVGKKEDEGLRAGCERERTILARIGLR